MTVETRKAEAYETVQTIILREAEKSKPGTVAPDSNGDPMYDEAKHGRFSLICVRIDRRGRECGQVWDGL
jgi:hypothetical protein